MKPLIIHHSNALSALLLSVMISHPAAAHDGFSPESREGIADVIHLSINHGCDANPVIAQSVIFPTLNPIIKGLDDSGNEVPAPNDLADIIGTQTLEGLSTLIQERNIFRHQNNKTNDLGNSIGFYGKRGRLKAGLIGRVAFRYIGPFFVPNSCVKALQIETAIADICSTRPPALQPGKVSLFIPDTGSRIAVEARANGLDHGIGEPSILKVARDLKTNPFLDANGKPTRACGDGITVRVTPSAEDIDKNLPIPGYWPVNKKQSQRD